MSDVKIHSEWLAQLEGEFSAPYMKELRSFLKKQYQDGKIIYPKGTQYFEAFNRAPFAKVKVVIVGQDPYHGPGQAHGLCFSVLDDVRKPPSLQNIFTELKSDLQIPVRDTGNLGNWADQGILLLNSVLTVESGKPGSHQGKGWELFTDKVIHVLNERKQNLVFILWGSYAQKKASFVDRKRHHVIEGPHPSPLSAYRGFFGSKPFSETNDFLISRGETPIVWG